MSRHINGDSESRLLEKMRDGLERYKDIVVAHWEHRDEIVFTLGSLYTCCASIVKDTDALLTLTEAAKNKCLLSRLSKLFPSILQLGKGIEKDSFSWEDICEMEKTAFHLAEALQGLCEDSGVSSGFEQLVGRSSGLLEQAGRVWSPD